MHLSIKLYLKSRLSKKLSLLTCVPDEFHLLKNFLKGHQNPGLEKFSMPMVKVKALCAKPLAGQFTNLLMNNLCKN